MTSNFSGRLGLYRDALDDALADPAGSARDADPLAQLAGLAARGRALASGEAHAAGALAALARLAALSGIEEAISEAAATFESPQRFRETLYFARCLERDAQPALELLEARLYLEGAAAPAAAYPGLANGQASLLDATTFATLWREPDRQSWMLDMIDVWRSEYAPIYTSRHAEFNLGVDAVMRAMEELAPQANAVEQLNDLRRLGAPLAVAALAQFHDLERLFACPADAEGLAHALSTQPVCPHCAYRLGEDPPTADAQRVRHAVELALATQLSRLAQRVVPRLLARPTSLREDRLDRFVQVVQAADLSGLALVLDAGLVEFLRDLLDTAGPYVSLIDELARDFPEVTTANAHEVVEGFRRLVESELARDGGRFLIGRRDASP